MNVSYLRAQAREIIAKKGTSGLLFSFLLSLIIHASVFIINPTFSFSIGDRPEDSAQGFLIVELRREKVKSGGEQVKKGLKSGVGKGGSKKNRTLTRSGKGKGEGEGKSALKKGKASDKVAAGADKVNEAAAILPLAEATANESTVANEETPLPSDNQTKERETEKPSSDNAAIEKGAAAKPEMAHVEEKAVKEEVVQAFAKPAAEVVKSPLIEDTKGEVSLPAPQTVPEPAMAEPVQVSEEPEVALLEEEGEGKSALKKGKAPDKAAAGADKVNEAAAILPLAEATANESTVANEETPLPSDNQTKERETEKPSSDNAAIEKGAAAKPEMAHVEEKAVKEEVVQAFAKPAPEVVKSPLIEDTKGEVSLPVPQAVPEPAMAEPVRVSEEPEVALAEEEGEGKNPYPPESPASPMEASGPPPSTVVKGGLQEDARKDVRPYAEEATLPIQPPFEKLKPEKIADMDSHLQAFPPQKEGPERPDLARRAESGSMTASDGKEYLDQSGTGHVQQAAPEAEKVSVEPSPSRASTGPSIALPVLPGPAVSDIQQKLPAAAEDIRTPEPPPAMAANIGAAEPSGGDEIQKRPLFTVNQPEEKAVDGNNGGDNTAGLKPGVDVASAGGLPSVIREEQEIRVSEDDKGTIKIVEPGAEAKAEKKARQRRLHKILEPAADPMNIGIPVESPTIKIVTPAKEKVGNRAQEISGWVKGNGVGKVTLAVNGEAVTVPAINGRFRWDAVLKEGKNRIDAAIWDRDGYTATDQLLLEVLKVSNRFGLSIDKPAGRESESPVVKVEGRVGDDTVETVWVTVNQEAFEADVDNGYFEKTVFLKEKENSIFAEAANSAGFISRSEALNVTVKDQNRSEILVHLIWDNPAAEPYPVLMRRERALLDNETAAGRDVDVIELMSEPSTEKIFAARESSEGAYTLFLNSKAGARCGLIITLNNGDTLKRKVRVLGPFFIEGGRDKPVARFLMHEGIFWDEDEWFSGNVEGGNSITKYKSPEGVAWKEKKVE